MTKRVKNKSIRIKKASLHNLKSIDVEIPRNKLTVITGVSGSGKSSLAFDTLYAEGQRRFVESLSSYARQFLERMAKPDVEYIDGLPPAIAIEQHSPTKNPRSTVGTTTEVYDYLRILYGRIGKTYCRVTGNLVRKDTPETVIESLKDLDEGSKLIISSFTDIEINQKEELNNFIENGYFRLFNRETNQLLDIESDTIPKDFNNEKYLILIDRLVFRNDDDTISRFTDSLEKAFSIGNGRICIYEMNNDKEFVFSNHYEDPESLIEYIEPEPKLFSFNNPQGACPKCQGFGRTIEIDEDLVIPDRSKSLKENAIAPFKGEKHGTHLDDLLDIAHKFEIDPNAPIASFDDEQMRIIWEGYGTYVGIDNFFKKIEEKLYKVQNRVLLSRYRGYTKCKACEGSRLRTSARQVFINGKNIPELIDMPLHTLHKFLSGLKLSEYERNVVGQVLEEVMWRLELLIEIGLEYLTLSRLSHTLSGGESQRISLSTALGSSLVGTLYVLDEPSIGLHPRDTDKLINILYKLRDLGNTIVVVEHDPDIIVAADNVIDIGPFAGEHGGEIMFEGNVEKLIKSKKSLTGKFISGKEVISFKSSGSTKSNRSIEIVNPSENNLRMDNVKIPLDQKVVITGVSGSGKSTLVHDILYAGVKRFRGGYRDKIGKYQEIKGIEHIENVELVDQKPIGKSSRSTPATYTKVFDHIREIYSNTQEAKQLGWKPGHFSFNVSGGRCEVCEGEGVVRVDMQFLPDVTLECEACKGTRFKREVRNLLYKGKSIVDVLDMTVDEAIDFFIDIDKITRKLKVLQDVGLGYLRLGQASTNLSGGEAQRIKLAGHLDSNSKLKSLFIFDEPTTGLHLHDISKLMKCFDQLVENGNSVVIIEHNLHIIASANHIIDLGPGAGENGGLVVCEGTPKEVAQHKKSYTGVALHEFLKSDMYSTNT